MRRQREKRAEGIQRQGMTGRTKVRVTRRFREKPLRSQSSTDPNATWRDLRIPEARRVATQNKEGRPLGRDIVGCLPRSALLPARLAGRTFLPHSLPRLPRFRQSRHSSSIPISTMTSPNSISNCCASRTTLTHDPAEAGFRRSERPRNQKWRLQMIRTVATGLSPKPTPGKNLAWRLEGWPARGRFAMVLRRGEVPLGVGRRLSRGRGGGLLQSDLGGG